MSSFSTFVKDHLYVLLGVLCIIAVGVVYLVMTNNDRTGVSGDYVIYTAFAQGGGTNYIIPESPINSDTAEEIMIVVHIAGAVNNPGVIELPQGARINDAVAMAGGATEYADLARINLAAIVVDAMQIIVPTYGETPAVGVDSAGVSSAVSGISDGLVNINIATAAELQTLPGVGLVLSQNIIDFREAHGEFSSVEELIHVPRIGAVTLDRLRPLVTV